MLTGWKTDSAFPDIIAKKKALFRGLLLFD